MVKKIQTPKYDLDAALDIPEFDFDIPPPKDDRKPTTKIKDAAVKGAKSALGDNNFIRRLIRDTLPPEFGQLDDMRIETVEGVKKLYNSAAQEIKPSLFEMSRSVNRLVPGERKKLKSALDKVEGWSKPEDKYGIKPGEARRQKEANLAIELGAIFEKQQDAAEERDLVQTSQDRAEQRIKDVLDLDRHKAQIKLLTSISQSAGSLAQYNTSVGIKFQRKTLEIQLRQYDLAVESHNKAMEANERISAELKLIAKNTALPEFVKMRKSEAWKESMRNKFISSMNTGLFGSNQDMIKGFFERLSKQVKEKASNAAGVFSNAAFGADQLVDAKQMAKDYNVQEESTGETVAGMAAGAGAQHLANKAGKWVNGKLEKNEKVGKFAKDVGYATRNAKQSIHGFANDIDYSDGQAKTLLKAFLRMGLGPAKADTRIQEDNLLLSDPNSHTGLRSQTGFTNQNSKSINEIIPGFLARIYRELQVLRTGNTDIDLTTYDYTKNTFSETSTANKRILDTLVNKDAKQSHSDRVNRIMEMIGADKSLDKETRDKLAEHLTISNIDSKEFSRDRLTKSGTFTKALGADQGKKAADLFKGYYGDDESYSSLAGKEKRNKLNSELNNLGRDFNDPRAMLQELINMGQYERVKDLGLINERTGRMDVEKLVSYYNSQVDHTTQANKVTGENILKGSKAPNKVKVNASIGGSSDIVQAIQQSSSDTKEQLNTIVSQFKLDPVTQQITNTNVILERMEKLISNNLKIVIHRERRESSLGGFRQGFSKGFSNVNYDTSGLRNKAGSIYGKVKGKLGTAKGYAAGKVDDLKDFAEDGVDGLSDLLNEIESDIQNSGGAKSIKDKAREHFDKLKQYVINKKEQASGYDTSTITGSARNLYNKTAGRVVKPLNRMFRRGFKMTKPLAKAGLATAGVAARVGINTTRNVVDRLVDIRDVYVEGEESPRIKAAKLRLGLYFDKVTGKAIKRLHQIKGDVIDENGEVVLSKDEIKKSYTRTSKGGIVSLVTSLGKAAFTVINDIGNTVMRVVPVAVSSAINVARFAGRNIRNLFDQPVDMYLKDDMGKPILLAVTMRAGGYYSKVTGNVVDRPSKIDGAILDKDGNHVVTEEQLKTGLVDKDGKSVDGPYTKMLKLGMASVRGVVNVAKGIASSISGAIGKGVDFGGDFLNGFFDKFNKLLGGGKSYDVLVEIKNLLDARLPKTTKLNPFDRDGDGDRDGSAKDILENEKNREKIDSDMNKKDGPRDFSSGRENTFDRLANGAKSLKDKAMGLFGLGDDDDDDDDDDDLTDAEKRRKRRKARVRKGRGRFGKLRGGRFGGVGRAATGAVGRAAGGGLLRGAGSLALRAAGPLAMGYGAVNAVSDLSDGNYAGAATNAGIGLLGAVGTFGLGATVSGIGAAGSAVAGGVMSAGGAMAGLLSNPIGWGILAAGAVAYGGYKLYKYITSPNMKPLARMRMAQYGFASGEEDQIKKVQAFEKFLLPFVKYEEDGKAQLQIDEKAAGDINKLFGFDPDDKAMAARFATWVQNRFKPVYLNSLSVIKNLGIKTELANIDSAEPEDKLKYFMQAKFDSGPYNVYASPFPEITELTVGKKIVDLTASDAEKVITEETKVSGNKKKQTMESSDIAGAAAGAATADGARDKLGINDDTVSEKDKQIKDYTRLGRITEFMKGAAASILNATPIGKMALAAVSFIGEKVGKAFGFRVDADEAVRFKTYGLIEMDSSKVRALRNMEELISEKIEFKGDGSAVWTGVINDFLREVKYMFSLPDLTGPKTQNFVKWFSERFMPTYLNYRAWLKQSSGQDKQDQGQKALKAQDRYDVASKVTACQVWDKVTSPWDGYTLNTDPGSTKENLIFLRDAAKDSKLTEVKKKDAVTKDVTNAVNAQKPSDAVGDNLKKTVSNAKDTIETAQKEVQAKDAGEAPPASAATSTATGQPTSSASTSSGGLKTAEGDVKDGSGGDAFIEYGKGARLAGMNPAMLKLFKGMAQEYGEKTGKKILVTSGYRTMEEQAALHDKDPKKAAAPGRSLHEFGLAVDVDSKIANELDQLGLLRKYGFTRPVGGEPWHMEMSGIQKNIDKAKKDAGFAEAGINASPGRGGGGWGTNKNAGKYSRNPNMANDIFNKADGSKNAVDKEVNGLPPSTVNSDQAAQGGALMKSRSITGMLAGVGSDATKDKLGVKTSGTANSTTATGASTDNGGAASAGDAEGYNKVSLPSGGKGYDNVKDTIKDAAKLVGVDEKAMVTKAAVESGFRPGVKSDSTSASGLYQFTGGTWKEMMGKYAKKYGIPADTSPSDPRANAIMAAQYMKDNEGIIAKAKGAPVNDTDRYMAHYLGPTGASKILSASDNAIAADIRPDAAADKNNRNNFYHPDGRPKTVAEFKAGLDKKLSGALTAHGVDPNQFGGGTATTASAPAATNPNIVRASFQAPTTNNTSPTENTANRLYDIRQREAVSNALKPAPVEYKSSVPTPGPIMNTPGSQDKNSFFNSVTKYTDESLATQKSQLEVLNKILNSMDPAKFAEVIAKTIGQAVKGSADNGAKSSSGVGGSQRGAPIDPTQPPVSMKRMT